MEVQGIELGSAERECGRKRSRTRNTWAVGSEQGSGKQGRRTSVKILGIDSDIDEGLKWRVKWGQRGIGLFGFIALILYVASGDTNVGLQIATVVFCTIVLICLGILYYKNVSFVIVKRLLREPNVVLILLYTLCNWIIDTMQPGHSFSSINGFLYALVANGFVFMDALKLKSRILVISIGILFTLLNIYNIYLNTFGNSNEGLILLEYTIQGKEHSFMKRYIKQSMFLQILLFSSSGVYTMIIDKKQEYLIFATGIVYRETGTTSKHVEDTQHLMKMERERVSPSLEKKNDATNII